MILNDKSCTTQPQELEAIRIKLGNYFPDSPIDLAKVKIENLDDSDIIFNDDINDSSSSHENGVIKNEISKPDVFIVENAAISKDPVKIDEDPDSEFFEDGRSETIRNPEENMPNRIYETVKDEPNIIEPILTTFDDDIQHEILPDNVMDQFKVKMQNIEYVPPRLEAPKLMISHVKSQTIQNSSTMPEMMQTFVQNILKYGGIDANQVLLRNITMGNPWSTESFENDTPDACQFRSFDKADFWNFSSNKAIRTAEYPQAAHASHHKLQMAKKTTTKNERSIIKPSTIDSSKVAKKTTTFRAVHNFNPKENVVALGKAKKENYIANYLKIPKESRTHGEISQKIKSTTAENDAQKKMEKFEAQEKIRKEIITEASQTREFSPTPPEIQPPKKKATRSSVTEFLCKVYCENKGNKHLRGVKVKRIEYDRDTTVQKYFSDFMKRDALYKVKIEPEEYTFEPRRQSVDDKQDAVGKNYPWQPEDEMWANLLDEVINYRKKIINY